MIRWLLGSAPLLVLLVTLLGLHWKARSAGAAALLVALLVGGLGFGGGPYLLIMALGKGFALTLFVSLIIWTSSFMYQMVSETGSVPVISRWMSALTSDRLLLGLLIAWCLSAVIQAVAGFGVPVAVCAPLMMAAGFDPLVSAVSTLVGHAWSITFGSMASSFYTLTLATGSPPEFLGRWVALTFVFPTILTGLAVAHILEGKSGIRRVWLPVVLVGSVMCTVQYWLASVGSAQIASLVGALSGVALLAVISPRHVTERAEGQSIHLALAPYYALLSLTLISQIGPVKAFFKPYALGFNFPSAVTREGFMVAQERSYAAIGLFSHPAPIIALGCLFGLLVYVPRKLLTREGILRAARNTAKQAWPTTVGVLTMVMMALVMNDTGMTSEMAKGVARVAGPLFPVVSPFIGALGCFMTGSNTNANVLFGSFQMETARALSRSITLISASGTAGASLASSIAPAKVILGSSTSGLQGREAEVFRRCLPYCLLIVFLLGLQTLFATSFLTVVP